MKTAEHEETKTWPRHPVIYEVNTWVWLNDLSRKHQRRLDLATVPEQEWDAIADRGFDAVWFMGVWERSPTGIGISMRNEGLLQDFRRALPDFAPDDNVGSPYCVRRYVVDEHFGGPKGLATARRLLDQRGLRLILDFVPNHVAPDNPWTRDHPEYFMHGSAEDARSDPGSFIELGGKVFACGRDPYFPAWPDVLQLNAFHPGLRQAVIETIWEIAEQCDGIRCDMAMLMLNATFERTWGGRAGSKPNNDYWTTVIPAIKGRHPQFRFIAEAYWDLEWELQQQGFDFCYDKKLYDRMEHGPAESVRQHLLADLSYQEGMVRFIENHDEPRAAAAFPDGRSRAAAVAILTLPGARLLHEGQFEGWRVRLPVFLGRRPAEPVDHDLSGFYGRLLNATHRDLFRNGEWRLCERSGWPDNQSCQNIFAWCWVTDTERALIVVNYGQALAQARVQVPWDELRSRQWRLDDGLSGDVYERDGDEMRNSGLYVDLAPWQCHVFQVRAVTTQRVAGTVPGLGLITAPVLSGAQERVVASGAAVEKLAGNFECAEGPTCDAEGNLFFTDQPNDRIMKWSVNGKLSTFLQPAGRANGMYFDPQGQLVAAADEKTALWSIAPDGKVTVILDSYGGKPLNGPNDVWVRPDGALYFTDPFYKRSWWTHDTMPQDGQHVYFLSADRRQLVRVTTDLEKPNGIIGTPDGKTMYVADIGAGKTFRFDIASDGRLMRKTLVAEQGSDGMTLDNEGNLYLTGKGVLVFDKTGRLIEEIQIPDEEWTGNVSFCGQDRRTLFITASKGLYRIRTRVRGANAAK